MSEANFSLIFRGEAVDNGEIDVRELAPTLLAMGDLLQAVNDVLNNDKAQIAVKVRATRKGCFEVDMSIVQSMIDNILTYALAKKDEIAAANDLMDLVLKVGSGVGGAAGSVGGLIALLKFLRGRKPDKVKAKGGQTVITIEGNVFVADPRAIELAQNIQVREQAKKLVSVLDHDGIDSIAARQPDGKEMVIEPKDKAAFAIPEQEEQELSNQTREMTLQIISLSFKEDNKWRVSDGSEPFTVLIEDEDFLRKIANDQVTFSKNDYLKCDVREKQVMTTKGLKMERSVISVKDHIFAARQLRLF
jgi:hypothetical protein